MINPSPKAAEPSRQPRKQVSPKHSVLVVVAFVAAHLVLAILMRNFRFLGLAHALGCVGAGLLYVATTRKLPNVAILVAYLIGCEVLWRMTKVAPFWEFGKYATLSMLLLALARMKWRRNRVLALAYFGMLIPSIAMTITSIPMNAARQALSFNLSGPLLITFSVLFFSNIRLTADQLRTVFFVLLAPTAGIALLCYLTTSRAQIEFLNASNDMASGGFGANQVSAVLGLTAMFLVLLAFERRLSWRMRIPLLAIAMTLATQTVLTFARGGIVLAFAGVCAALFFMLRGNPRARMSVVLVSIVIVLVGKFIVEPRLDTFTGGQLSVRYGDSRSTGRDAFVDSELAMFKDSPVLGVGPGMGYFYRIDHELKAGASHTEYTRMLGEHGLFGIVSLACLFALGARAVRGARELSARALACAMIVWAGLFLAIYGTRIAAPAVVFGLAFSLHTVAPAKQGA